MTGFAKAVLSAILATVVLVAGDALADTQSFDLETIEVQSTNGQAIIAMDVPEGSEIKAIDNPQRGEMMVTFTGVSLRLPKRVHSGSAGDALTSVDVEPWFIDGQRVTRMVIRYPEGADAKQQREGDLLMVTVDAPEGQTGELAAEETEAADEPIAQEAEAEEMPETARADAGASEHISAEIEDATPAEATAPTSTNADAAMAATEEAFESMESDAQEESAETIEAIESDVASDVASEVAPETWNPATQSFVSPADPAERNAPVYDTAPEPVPASGEPVQTANVAETTPTSTPTESRATAPTQMASESMAQSEPVAQVEHVGPYGQSRVQKPTSDVVTQPTWSSEPVYDTQPELPDMDAAPTITIDLQGADVRTVLRSLSETSGWNIVANADVQGEVSLKLDDVPWRRALSVVLKTQGLGYVVEDGVIRVAKAEGLRAEVIARETAARKADELVPLETVVVPVRFAAADELLSPIQTLLTARGKIKEDLRTNAIVVTDIPAVLPQVRDLVQQLDGRTPQVEIVAKLVDVDVSAVRELGINWGLTNLHSTSQGLSGNAFVNSPIGQSAGTVNFGVIRDFADLDVTLDMLEQNQKANIISNPKISTVNNREARILVGQEIPLIVQDEAGNPITELKKIGIELRVTPYINQDGLVTLDLHPEVSDLASQSTASGGVIINTSEADTRVMVADGETAVIGGLIRSNETVVKTGVPVLHRLPIIGGLFGSESTANNKRELVIFVTPRIIN